jgi:hypothetical protein
LNLFDKIFGAKKQVSPSEQEERSTYMPDIPLPTDEKFAVEFNKNGGKFLYCTELNEVYDMLDKIIIEQGWQSEPFFTTDKNLISICQSREIPYNSDVTSLVFFTGCEFLIAHNGSILMSEQQLGDKKIVDLPDHIVVFAKTSQLTPQINDGLHQIKRKYDRIPSNITALKNFKLQGADKPEFLSYGSPIKNVYLLLLEDL